LRDGDESRRRLTRRAHDLDGPPGLAAQPRALERRGRDDGALGARIDDERERHAVEPGGDLMGAPWVIGICVGSDPVSGDPGEAAA